MEDIHAEQQRLGIGIDVGPSAERIGPAPAGAW